MENSFKIKYFENSEGKEREIRLKGNLSGNYYEKIYTLDVKEDIMKPSKQIRYNKISQWTIFLGVLSLVIGFLIPYDAFEALFGNLRTLGLLTVYVLPALGLLGGIFSILARKPLNFFLNLIMIFSFPILMFLGSL